MPLKLFFMGTGAFAVPSLRAVKQAGHEVTAVICQPDRPRGRGQHSQAPQAKQAALELGLKVLQYEKIKDPGAVKEILSLGARAGCVAAYGQILPIELLDGVELGCLNLHASLLPKYRGAAPVAWALANGETETGVTVQRIVPRLDAGDILGQKKTAILEGEDSPALTARLADLGSGLLKESLAALEAGQAVFTPQDEQAATKAPLIKKADGAVDFNVSALALSSRCRAFRAWPGFFCFLGGESPELRLHKICPASDGTEGGKTGEILEMSGRGWRVACGDKESAWVESVQAAGGKIMSASEYARGHRVEKGMTLRGQAI